MDIASSGKEAIERVTERNLRVIEQAKARTIFPYRLIFVEQNLSMKDGFQTTEQIREIF